ncbi:MAG TPA: response regulator [Candidatus Acidoferrales bacterium]|nr:response regulator [Candidatus Acidoferrales bacterium]
MAGRILLVDDDPELRAIMNRLLCCGGYKVAEAQDGETALALMETQAFDVVIADQALRGGLEGTALLGHHNRIAPHKGRILLTGHVSEQLVKICRAIRALYLAKPCTFEQLKAKIEAFSLGAHRRRCAT